MNTEEGQAYARTTDPDTSQDAADQTQGVDAARLELIVWTELSKYPQGLTCHELVAATGVAYQSLTPRLKPLRTRGLILDSGTRRPGRSNRQCIVWIATLPSSTESA